jgi:hypothetical protein
MADVATSSVDEGFSTSKLNCHQNQGFYGMNITKRIYESMKKNGTSCCFTRQGEENAPLSFYEVFFGTGR